MGQKNKCFRNLPRHLIPGALLLIGLLFFCLSGLFLLKPQAETIDLNSRIQSPSLTRPCGTDSLGRCVFSRSLIGTLTSVSAGIAALLLTLGIGVSLGVLAGSGPKLCDALIMMLTDIVLAFPILLLAISLTSLLGASLLSCILGVSLAGWAVWARMARGMIISTREKEYVQAARVMGVRGIKLTFQYILPDLWPSIITAACLHAGTLLVLISGLSFLGFGSGPQHPELGSMMRDARMYLTTAPWVLLCPGFMIIWSVSGFYVLGAGLRKHFQLRERFDW